MKEPEFPQAHLRRRRNSPGFSKLLNSYLISKALQALVSRQRTGESIHTHEELSALLYDEALRQGGDAFVHDYDAQGINNRYRMKYSKLVDTADSAASYALNVYNPNFLKEAAERGHNSKRSPVLPISDLDKVRGLTIKESAAVLHVSEATVSRLRARGAAREAARVRAVESLLSGVPVTDEFEHIFAR
jgi:crotonobetainyl-CoA:carnitine CoA-transferase CaiB-like acyl-CoA transferase